MHPAATGRARRKRAQVETFALLLKQLVAPDVGGGGGGGLAVVDMGAGAGNLSLPLAAAFPQHAFTAVEMKGVSAALLEQRAAAAGLRNCRAHVGMIETYTAPFDVCLALHACGNASDLALDLAVRRRAAFIVAPCCVGKIKARPHTREAVESSTIITVPPPYFGFGI